MAIVNVHLLPALVEGDQLQGSTMVVVDILRASTTIITALAAGAKAVIPCLEVDTARQLKAHRGSDVLLAGERGGLAIDGFDLGNSPDEFTPERVHGKTIAFTTTNGTKAMRQCRGASRVLIGAFVNFSAICDELIRHQSVGVLCAGTENQITREDVLFAGAVAYELHNARPDEVELNDQAHIALDAWRKASADFSTGTPLAESLRCSQGGRNLMEIGLERDIDIAAAIDRFDEIPELDLCDWTIA